MHPPRRYPHVPRWVFSGVVRFFLRRAASIEVCSGINTVHYSIMLIKNAAAPGNRTALREIVFSRQQRALRIECVGAARG